MSDDADSELLARVARLRKLVADTEATLAALREQLDAAEDELALAQEADG